MAFGMYPGATLQQRLKSLYKGAQPQTALPVPAAPAQPLGVGQPPPATGLPMAGMRTPPHLDPQHIASRLANQNFRREQNIYGQYVLPSLNQLRDLANTDRFSDEERAATLGPHTDALDQQYSQAQGNLARQLAERGLGSSSAMASGLGALASGEAQAHSGLVSGLYQSERDRQLQAQQQLLGASTGLQQGQSQQAGSLALAIQQLLLQKKQLDQQNGGGFLGDLLGGLGGIVGGFGGLSGILGRKKPGAINALVE